MIFSNDQKEILSCPNCGHKMRIPKYKKIRFTCTKCRLSITYDGKRKKTSLYIIFGILVIGIAYFSFFNDYFKYLQVKSGETQELCMSYYRKYPKGYFTEEVKFIEIKASKDITLVRDFIKEYLDSKKNTAVEKIKIALWAYEIDRYNEIVKTRRGLDPKAVSFFRNLLHYMRDQNLTNIGLRLKGNIDVKDFSEYSPEVIQRMDAQTMAVDKRTVSDYILEIRKHYEQGNIRSYEKIISNSIESSFENILSENFITVLSNTYEDTDLTISINYNIKNQEVISEDDQNMNPVIWVYAKEGTQNGFISYIQGVSINYRFDMNIPNTDINFSFEHNTNALKNINNVHNVEEGYIKMTEQNFQNYSDIISTKFGLEPESTP